MSDIILPSLQFVKGGLDSSNQTPLKGIKVFKIAKKLDSDFQQKQLNQRNLPVPNLVEPGLRKPSPFKLQSSPFKQSKEKFVNSNFQENTMFVPFESSIPPIPLDQKNSLRPTPNIFKDTAAQMFCFHDSNVGPVYKDQQIVKHSIVGQVEWFNNAESRLKPKEKLVDLDQLRKNTRRNSRKSLADISVSQARTKRKKKGTQNEQLEKFLNTKELVVYINDLERKIIQNRFIEEDELNKKNFMQKQAITRDSRVLEKDIKKLKEFGMILY